MAVPQIKRSDSSQSLVHLTRERREPDGTVPAFDVLKKIFKSEKIRGSGNEGYVKGNRPAVCLSEIPLSVLHQFAKTPDEEAAARALNWSAA